MKDKVVKYFNSLNDNVIIVGTLTVLTILSTLLYMFPTFREILGTAIIIGFPIFGIIVAGYTFRQHNREKL